MGYTKSLLTAAKTIVIESAEMPGSIAEGSIRLKLATASICGTDMHYFRHFSNAGFYLDYPVTLGHEACAHVVDPNGTDFKPGQLVAINPLMPCGKCEKCASGDFNMCGQKKFPGSATTKPHMDGFFRDYFDFPADRCRIVKNGVDPDHLTFAEPLACAMHAVNRADVTKDSKVLITGCGPMGLLATLGAHAKGAEVHVTDLKRESVDAAIGIGASRGFVGELDEKADGNGQYDILIEVSGSPHAYNQALQAVRKQGVIAILSLIQPSNVTINLHLNTLKEISSIGSILFTSEFDEAVDLIEPGAVDFDRLIAGRFPVAETQQACEMMASGAAIGKVLIKPA